MRNMALFVIGIILLSIAALLPSAATWRRLRADPAPAEATHMPDALVMNAAATTLPSATPVPISIERIDLVEDEGAASIVIQGEGAPGQDLTLNAEGAVSSTTRIEADGSWALMAPLANQEPAVIAGIQDTGQALPVIEAVEYAVGAVSDELATELTSAEEAAAEEASAEEALPDAASTDQIAGEDDDADDAAIDERTPTPATGVTSTATPQPTAPAASSIVITTTYPLTLHSHEAKLVNITLNQRANHPSQPTSEADSGVDTAVVVPPAGGTPGATLQTARGPTYSACAVGMLHGAAFEIAPAAVQCQSLDDPVVNWVWTVKPKPEADGGQILYARIDIVWMPLDGDGAFIRRKLWDEDFDIQTRRLFWNRLRFNEGLFQLGLVLLGFYLQLPFLRDRLTGRREL